MKEENKILAFSHIPKTAGTSFNLLLRRYYGGRVMSVKARLGEKSIYRYKDFLEDRAFFPNLGCMSGHPLKPFVDFGKHEKDFSWFAFFRDPEKRFISQYIHQQTGSDLKYKMDLIQWAESFNRSNMQVRWIAGTEDLNAAKQILDEKFDAVGITDEFDLSVDHLVRVNRLRGFSKYLSKRKMVSRSVDIREKLENESGDCVEVIKQCNDLDQKLYEYVKQKFSSQFENLENGQSENFGVNGKPCVTRMVAHKLNVIKFRVRDRLVYQPKIKKLVLSNGETGSGKI